MEPGSTAFIKQFNQSGVNTVNATNNTIDETRRRKMNRCSVSEERR
jgi:hypothetical protein